jgi:hypothetical protein
MEDLFSKENILKFWPTPQQTAKERVMSTTRFILYTSCILYLIRRDHRILMLGTLALLVLYGMYKNGMISDSSIKTYKTPMDGNIMDNVLMGDYIDRPDRSRANLDPALLKDNWDRIHPFQEGRWFAEHNFYSAPSTTIPNNVDEFLQGAYPNMFKPTCRENSMMCNPENSMGRGPEYIQRKTFERL